MNSKEVYRELRAVQEKYKNKKTETFEIRISDMAKDAADTIEALQQENAELKEKLVQFMSEENEKIIELQQQLARSRARQQSTRETGRKVIDNQTDEIIELRKQLAPLQGKAVLVMDMPEGCLKCPLIIENSEYGRPYCAYTKLESEKAGRLGDCPLVVVGGGEE
jgi:pyruvate/2-oxoglutarate dehydrogenase complex dihydrolipoamide acyltransferase (E2) component